MIDRKDLLGLLVLHRATRRRLVAGYWVCVLVLMALLAASLHRSSSVGTISPNWFYFVAIWFPLLLHLIRDSVTRPIRITSVFKPEPAKLLPGSVPPMDERDRVVADKMYSRAYAYLLLLVFTLVPFLTYLENPHYTELVFLRMPLLWFLWIVITSLPQSLILWNEPDSVEEQ